MNTSPVTVPGGTTESRAPRRAPTSLSAGVDVILRDGRTLRLRPPVRGDVPALTAFFRGLSQDSLYNRFHGTVNVDDPLSARFVDPDFVERGALIGVGEGKIVALGDWARLRDPRSAEAAFAVADGLQGCGIGTRLLERLAVLAGEAGIERFVAEVLPGNVAMLKMFAGAGLEVRREIAEGNVEVAFPIAATREYVEAVDLRDHVAVVASLHAFFRPRTVAVIGASARRGTIGGELFRNVLAGEFAGAAYPVNRKAEPVGGVRAFATIDEIPDEVDLAVICLPGEHVLAAADGALRAGVRALCVISAGFAELGAEGRARQDELLALVRAHGARLLGPNCLGIASDAARLNATFAAKPIPGGNVGFSSQSGALGLALLEAAAGRDLGLSAFVSIGNKADVSSNDLLEWWEEDEETDVVLLYLESFGNPRKFGRLARRVARRKPILALKGGTTRAGQRAASSHTAALAGSEAAVDALFHQAGVIRARTLEELLDATSLLASQPLPRGRRVGLLTNAGGLGILCADACEAAGLELPSLSPETEDALRELLATEASVGNPVDMLGGATPEDFERVLPILLADNRLDSLIVLFVPPVSAGGDEVAAALDRALAAAPTEKPVLGALMGARARSARLARFDYPESAARALARAAERAEWLRRPLGSMSEPLGVDLHGARELVESAEDGWLVPAEARALLEAFGIPLVGERVAGSEDEAAAAAGELGFPVVVKTAAAGVHKTETGGVALGLRDEGEVREAVRRIGPPVVVQPMASGVELLAGVVQDPVFGPLVAFGPGGVRAELIGGAGFRIAPLTDADAEELVHAGKAGRLVAGFRGAAADAVALQDLVLRLGRLGEELPEVAELDLNPVLAGPDGCVAVDARIRIEHTPPEHPAKSW
jgi:acetyl coenzyme A synthetase (ADP forming)-like protein